MKHLTNREEEIMEIFWAKGSIFVKEVIEFLHPCPMQIFERAVVGGLDHVQQEQVRVEAARERLHVSRGAPAADGKIDRKKDLPKLEHDSEP